MRTLISAIALTFALGGLTAFGHSPGARPRETTEPASTGTADEPGAFTG